ncbi:SDR family oxidoreductase [Rhodovastum atsumiense]|uniref:SDR family oxidoreductase n=1 Tax=Rhodovastum atsumiense TaxID=504468 RepID=A0A5M6J0M4_9PROT|nr:SDR family oxidoreductase [Rhodovastum atsumiense]KAA5613195.1 SDR family oxidoreductase [Rhodovastum atsumiense]CAH2600653.1 SDR family oxidoreductase [Rhodovastum atsumiense]
MSELVPSRVAVITGASSGIGLCTARLFATRGWRVGLIARGAEGLAEAAAQIRAAGGDVATAEADVADSAALDRATTTIEAALGPVTLWINNAGASFYGRFLDITEEEFHRVLHTTLLGTVNGTRIALQRMSPRQHGTIINVGSAVAYRGTPLQAPYSAAKFGVRGFTEAIRSELIHDRSPIHLGIVHPPSVNTPFFSHAGARMAGEPRPLPPVYQPEIIADAIWLAATERRREIRITGSTLQLSWLDKLAPGLADRLMAVIGFPAQRTTNEEVQRLRDPALFHPPTTSALVHGPFGREAFASSAQMWGEHHRLAVAVGLAVFATLLVPRRIGLRRR